MQLQEISKIISQTHIFESLPKEDHEKIAKVTEVIKYKKGNIIFKENELADAFYIIVEGEVEILKEGKDVQEVLAKKKSYDVFGEMAVIDELPRSATIRAHSDITLLKIEKDNFTSLLKDFSHISLEISRSICQTVRNTNKTYINDLEKRNKQLELAYDKLKKTQNELIKAEKLSVVGKFASIIIHDIKNPMTNIRAYAELIKLTAPDNQKMTRSAQIIMQEVDRLTKMTSELLDFVRGEIQISKTPVNLVSFIETMIDTVKEDFIKHNIHIHFDHKNDNVVLIDSEKMKRVFYNIITNCKDAIYEDGHIKITIEEDEKWTRIVIIDNGNGMDKETLNNIFEPFFTKKKKGTGLGMAIVKGIVESHGGAIKVFSELNTGTKFEISLPHI
ncbi:MAG: ATP-binding protein [Spirochaetes bacterium]|nr:ATP-binding protein [Spirochaetota bacterium]